MRAIESVSVWSIITGCQQIQHLSPFNPTTERSFQFKTECGARRFKRHVVLRLHDLATTQWSMLVKWVITTHGVIIFTSSQDSWFVEICRFWQQSSFVYERAGSKTRFLSVWRDVVGNSSPIIKKGNPRASQWCQPLYEGISQRSDSGQRKTVRFKRNVKDYFSRHARLKTLI